MPVTGMNLYRTAEAVSIQNGWIGFKSLIPQPSHYIQGVGRHPKTGKKKGGIKVHIVIHANEGVPSDIKFTSAATNDSFMLKPSTLNRGDIMAMDRAYIDYEKFKELTRRGVIYVTKLKKSLKYTINENLMYQTPDGLMEVRLQHVTFSKQLKGGDAITHNARIITYVDIRKHKLISLLTNDLDSDPDEIIAIYRKRREIELLFKQIKQNFPLKYFYGESANAIKIQIWVTLIEPSANGYAETLDTEMEFLGIGYNDKDRNDVLC